MHIHSPGIDRLPRDEDEPTLVSVIIRTLNRPLLLQRALNSVTGQDHRALEVIIVNDGGDAAAIEEMVAEKNCKCTLIHHAVPKGRVHALNAGVQASNGDFFAIHDDDDEWHPSFVSRMLIRYRQLTQEEKFPVFGVISGLVREQEVIRDNAIYPVRRKKPHSENSSRGIVNYLRYAAIEEDAYPIQWLIRRDVCTLVGYFNPDFDLLEDREFFLRVLAAGEIGVLPEPLAIHHVRLQSQDDNANSLSSDRPAMYHTLLENRLCRATGNNEIPNNVFIAITTREILNSKLAALKGHGRTPRRLRSAVHKLRDVLRSARTALRLRFARSRHYGAH